MINEQDRGSLDIQGVVTQQKLVRAIFARNGEDVEAIATDDWLNKSRDAYNAPWLTREIVQNFVDHNGTHPGTLDGVRFIVTDLPDGTKRFIVEGDWAFTNLTGVLGMDSDKPKGKNTAGGNGLALKQSAIRFLRDFGVRKFEIQGERWTVNYRLARADEVNSELEHNGSSYHLEKDWLVGIMEKTTNSGRNAYVIETGNSELMGALGEFPTLGVSKDNPYLQGMDYANEHGAIKWLPKGERGRLFINGQIMGYGQKGDPSKDFWLGPHSVTIRLDNLKYGMTMDRPPVNKYDLGRYVSDSLIKGMAVVDLVGQLKRSEYLWAGHATQDDYEELGYMNLIRAITESLVWKFIRVPVQKDELVKYFKDKKYVAYDGPLGEEDSKNLQEKGYVLCPSYFERLGMRPASSILKPEKKPPTREEQRTELIVKLKKAEAAAAEAVSAVEEAKREIELFDGVEENPEQPEPVQIEQAPVLTLSEERRGGFPWRRVFGAGAAVFAVAFAINTLRQGNGSNVAAETSRPSAAAGTLPPQSKATFEIRTSSPTRTPSQTATLTPEQQKTLQDLNKAIQQNTPPPTQKQEKNATEKYQDWKNSNDFYGQLGDNAKYINGISFNQLIADQYRELVTFSGSGSTQTNPAQPQSNEEFRKEVQAVVNNNRPPEDVVGNIQIVEKPTASELAQLGLLRLYIEETTGLAVSNDFFVYRGGGANGVNIDKKAIGINENVLKVRFIEALRVFIHEVSHNYGQANGHDDKFHDAMESTLMTVIDRTSQIAKKLEMGQALTADEKVILDIADQWENLRAK